MRTTDILMGHIHNTSYIETGGGRCLNLNPYELKVKQSLYRPGVAQRVPGS